MKFQPDEVYHLAANVDSASSGCHDTNATGTLNIVNSCVQYKIKRLVFTSSAAVYRNGSYGDLHPIGLYGATKLYGENLIWAAVNKVGIDNLNINICRLFNVYGPRQKSGLIANVIRAILNNDPIVVYGDGSQHRDYVYVKDVVNELVRSDAPSVRNVGTGTSFSVLDMIQIIGDLLRVRYPVIKSLPPRDTDIQDSCSDVRIPITRTMESSLIETIEYYRAAADAVQRTKS
jgi:UDP-glucose 4-epimerase